MPRDSDDRFWREVRPVVLSYVWRRFPRFAREDVEDAAQEACAHYLQYRRRHDVHEPIALLSTMARRAAVSIHRQKRAFEPIDGGPDGFDPPGHKDVARLPEGVDPVELACFLVYDWVARHRPEDEPLARFRGEGLSHGEIAARLGLTHDVVRKRFSRLCEAIRSHYSELGIDPCLEAWRDGGERA